MVRIDHDQIIFGGIKSCSWKLQSQIIYFLHLSAQDKCSITFGVRNLKKFYPTKNNLVMVDPNHKTNDTLLKNVQINNEIMFSILLCRTTRSLYSYFLFEKSTSREVITELSNLIVKHVQIYEYVTNVQRYIRTWQACENTWVYQTCDAICVRAKLVTTYAYMTNVYSYVTSVRRHMRSCVRDNRVTIYTYMKIFLPVRILNYTLDN
jgi:hypothetical protein